MQYYNFQRFAKNNTELLLNLRKRQIIRRSLKSTPPIMSGVVSGIHPEGYLTMA